VKNALLIPLRYLLRLLLCILFALIVLYCSQLSRGTSIVQGFSFALHETIVFFPFIVLLCLFLISFMPLRRPGNMVISFLFLLALSTVLLSFGVLGLDSLSVKIKQDKPAGTVKTKVGTIIRENDMQAWYALGTTADGKSIQGLVRADFNSQNDVLSIRERAAFPETKLNEQAGLPAIIRSIMTDAASVNIFVRQKGSGARFFTALALAFFFCTLWFFPRLTPWPLFGALITLSVFRLALLFTAATVSGDFTAFVNSLFSAKVGSWLPQAFLLLAGAALLIVDILVSASRKKREGSAA
jgi:hypothetical protein